MAQNELMIYADGRWRALDASTGRVQGWQQRVRFAVLRGERVQALSAARVLRELRALQTGAPGAVRAGRPCAACIRRKKQSRQRVAPATTQSRAALVLPPTRAATAHSPPRAALARSPTRAANARSSPRAALARSSPRATRVRSPTRAATVRSSTRAALALSSPRTTRIRPPLHVAPVLSPPRAAPARSLLHTSPARAAPRAPRAVPARFSNDSKTGRAVPPPSGREYSLLEDHAIVAWLAAAPARARIVNGNRVWRELQAQYKELTGVSRTWHSLRNRYLRYVLPALGTMMLPDELTSRLRAAAATGELKERRQRRSPARGPPAQRSAWSLRPRTPAPRSISPPTASIKRRHSLRSSEAPHSPSSPVPPAARAALSRSPAPRRSLRYSEVTQRFASPQAPVPAAPPPVVPRTRRLYNPVQQ